MVYKKKADKLKIEKRVLSVSLAGSILVAALEAFMAYFLHSKTILMDFVFACFDLVMMYPFIALVPYLYKPVSEKRPYGFSQVESLFVCIKYIIFLFVVLNLIIENAKVLSGGGHTVDAGVLVGFELILNLFSILIYFVLRHFSEKYASSIIKSELYMWKVDIMSTCSIMCAFAAQLFLQKTAGAFVIPYIDSTAAILIALFLFKEPVVQIINNLKELILFAPKEEVMEQIRQAVEENIRQSDYVLAFLDVIQTGRKTWVEIYVRSRNDLISVKEFKQIQRNVSRQLGELFDQIYVEIIPEIEKNENTF